MIPVSFHSIFLSLIFLFSTASGLFAQVNTEALRKEGKDGLFSTTAFRYALLSGNSEYWKLGADTRLDWKKDCNSAFVVVDYQRGEKSGSDFLRKGFVHLRATRGVFPWLAAEVFFQKEFNDFLLLLDRRLAGSGLRWDLLGFLPAKNRSARLQLGTGAMWEAEDLDAAEGNSRLLRSTNYLSAKVTWAGFVTFLGTAYWQPKFSDFSDYRLLAQVSLDVEIAEHVFLDQSVKTRLDSQPPAEVHSDYDLELASGLKVKF